MNFYAVSKGAIILFYFFMEETGRVKTDLGECNLNDTCLVGECSKF